MAKRTGTGKNRRRNPLAVFVKRRELSCAGHLQGDGHHHVVVQGDFHRVFADGLERAFRQAHFSLFTSTPVAVMASAMSALPTEPNRRPSTPASGRRQQRRLPAFRQGLGQQPDFGLLFFQLGAAGFKFLQVGFSVARLAFALRDQEVGQTVLHLDDVAQLTQVGHFFQKNDLHVAWLLNLSAGRVRHQGQETGALDGGRQLTLIASLGAGDAGWMILPFSAMKSFSRSTPL